MSNSIHNKKSSSQLKHVNLFIERKQKIYYHPIIVSENKFTTCQLRKLD